MSIEAIKFVKKITNKKFLTSPEKFLLSVIADRCNEQGECWPSLACLEEDTLMDWRTIIRHRTKLIEKGLLQLTGNYKGRSNQIPIMRLIKLESQEMFKIKLNEKKINTDIVSPLSSCHPCQSDTSTPVNLTPVPLSNREGFPCQIDRRNLKEELKKETTTETRSSSFFSEQIEKEILELKLERDIRTNDEFLSHVQKHVENHSSLNFPLSQRIVGIKKLLRKMFSENVIFEVAGSFSEQPLEQPKPKPTCPFTQEELELVRIHDLALKGDPSGKRIAVFISDKQKQEEAKMLSKAFWAFVEANPIGFVPKVIDLVPVIDLRPNYKK